MRWQRALSQLIFCSLLFLTAMASLNSAVFAQDLSKTVLPLTQLKLLGPSAELKFATGFCLTEDCRFVGTNYHVAMMAQIRKIKGDRVIHRYMATGPDDDGATNNDGPSANPMKYNPGRDIAIYELRYPLPHYHGIPFSLNDLQLGQEVDIYAYPTESLANFVSKAEPWLAQSLFPSTNKETISSASADLYPRFVSLRAADSPQGRHNDPPEVKTLRKEAQQQADSMRNLVAVQSFAWGSGDKAPAAFAEYEVRILEGFQRFREYPDGKRELQSVPFPPLGTAVVSGGEWSELPQMVATASQVKIRQ